MGRKFGRVAYERQLARPLYQNRVDPEPSLCSTLELRRMQEYINLGHLTDGPGARKPAAIDRAPAPPPVGTRVTITAGPFGGQVGHVVRVLQEDVILQLQNSSCELQISSFLLRI
jgi:transcription antitermination factor NusG